MNPHEFQLQVRGRRGRDTYQCIHCRVEKVIDHWGALPTEPCPALEQAAGESCPAQPPGYVHEYSIDTLACKFCAAPDPRRGHGSSSTRIRRFTGAQAPASAMSSPTGKTWGEELHNELTRSDRPESLHHFAPQHGDELGRALTCTRCGWQPPEGIYFAEVLHRLRNVQCPLAYTTPSVEKCTQVCTCPMQGPTGLMAVGCTCGRRRR